MIADRIKDLREKNGLTQKELAKKLNITRSSVNAWEMGISLPSTQNVIELTRLFGVSSDYILCIDSKNALDVSGLSESDIQLLYSIIRHLSNRSEEK